MKRKIETPKGVAPASDPRIALKPLLPITWLGTAWMENLSAVGSELTAFVIDRIKEDVKTQHALLHCKSLAEVQYVQVEFLQKACDLDTAWMALRYPSIPSAADTSSNVFGAIIRAANLRPRRQRFL